MAESELPAELLRRLADEYNDRSLRANPFRASEFGLPEYDALAPDASVEADAALRADVTSIQRRVDELDGDVSGIDRLLLTTLKNNIREELLQLDCRTAEYNVTALPMSGPAALFGVAARTPLPTPRSAADYLTRLRGSADWIDSIVVRLREGAARGRTPVASLARLAVEWTDAALADPAPAALLKPEPPAGWDGAEAWRVELDQIAREVVRPAVERWRDVVRDELLPVARPDEKAGVGWLPDGEADYLRAIEMHTTLPLTARELHDIGLQTIERLEERARELGRVIGLADLDAVHAAFQGAIGADPQAALEASRTAIKRAEARAHEVLGPPVAPPCAVEPMPETVAAAGMPPHYTLPRSDGSRPGTYWFNTLTASIGTGWDLEAVAFHEAVPGHHLQLARAQAETALPRLLTQSLVTVHAEGWGLYAERLSGEMGLYSSVEQEIGAIFMEMHRAGRLVVDTGLHAFGWSRQQALDFLIAHVPVDPGFIASEVDRYISWPGQALAYLTGQREILRLREMARVALSERFDLPGFHAAVLDHGSLPMPALEMAVSDWIVEVESADVG
jgi:uncharacterized protein (DUF885 family)